jgi:hypothetical protein
MRGIAEIEADLREIEQILRASEYGSEHLAVWVRDCDRKVIELLRPCGQAKYYRLVCSQYLVTELGLKRRLMEAIAHRLIFLSAFRVERQPLEEQRRVRSSDEADDQGSKMELSQISKGEAAAVSQSTTGVTRGESFLRVLGQHRSGTGGGAEESTAKRVVVAEFPIAETWKPLQIIECMQPETWRGLYVIGSFDRKITFYSQQVRALNLIRALFDVRDIRYGAEIAVVGAGAAGLSAAVAAAHKGCRVVLYDRKDAVLPIQAASTQRFLHPHIYDWPDDGSNRTDAELPVLSWSADYADRVVSGLRKEFNRWTGLVSFQPRSRITQILPMDSSPRVRVIGNEGTIDRRFDTVILAVGFGIDEGGGDTPSYWSGDYIDGPFDGVRQILISGAGDGGLIDLARASLRSSCSATTFHHDEAVDWFSHNSNFQEIARQMQLIDDVARESIFRSGAPVNLFREYSRLSVPAEILEQFRLRRRSDTEVTFNYPTPGIFSLDSALINRLVAFLLLRTDGVRLKLGKARLETGVSEGRRRVAFEGPPISTELFDFVIMRHGPPAGAFKNTFPGLYSQCAVLGGKLSRLALTGVLSQRTKEWYLTSGI